MCGMDMRAASLHEWFATPLGARVLAYERGWLDRIVPDIFGYHAVQIGLPGMDLLRESRIANRVTVDPGVGARVRAAWHELPIESQSVDLCVLPHVLEFAANPQETPHAILREVDRIMRPEGRILFLAFNPWSLFGAKRLWASDGAPWNGQFVSLVRMKDWLQLLGFEITNGELACFIPPCETERWQSRFAFMESLGQRWWRVGGAIYMLDAIKRVSGMRLIAPAWSDQRIKERKLASVAKREPAHLKVIK